MIDEYFLLSFKSLKNKKLRSWLTVLGIFIGVAAVVSLIGLGEGLRIAIISQFGISSTEVLSVQAGGLSGAGPPGTGVVNPLTQQDSDAIERISTVETTIPRIIESGKLEYNDIVGFGSAMSIPSGQDRKLTYEILELETVAGRLLKDGDNNKVALGYNFYSDDAGFEKPMRVGETLLIKDKKFEIVGFAEKKGSIIFDNIIHINEEPLKELFDVGDEVDVIAVKVKDKDLIDEAQEDIEKLMRKRRDVKKGEEDFQVETPQSTLSQIDDILVGVNIFIVIIASISIIIGAIGIVNTMFTSVVERRKQIGIMKSIGARNEDIFMLFSVESGLLGLTGGIIGTIFGTAISYFGTIGINNWVNSSADPQINFFLVFGALLGSYIIGTVSGIVPAMQAAKLHPVDALRK